MQLLISTKDQFVCFFSFFRQNVTRNCFHSFSLKEIKQNDLSKHSGFTSTFFISVAQNAANEFYFSVCCRRLRRHKNNS